MMQEQTFTGGANLQLGNGVWLLLATAVVAGFLNNATELLDYGLSFLVLLPLAVLAWWLMLRYVARTKVIVNNTTITLMKGDRCVRQVPWQAISLVEYNKAHRSLDFIEPYGNVLLRAPMHVEQFSELKNLALRNLMTKPKTEFRYQPHRSYYALSFFSITLLICILVGMLNAKSIGTVLIEQLPLTLFFCIAALNYVSQLLFTPTEVLFTKDAIALRAPLRAWRIPYHTIESAKLVENGWAPPAHKRNFLAIKRKRLLFPWQKISGFEVSSGAMLAALEQKLPQLKNTG